MNETPDIAVAATIAAPAARAYAIIADYVNGHPRIVPPKYFRDLVVERGGTGAGTEFRFEMRAMGTRRVVHATVAEPEPGRVLVERYPDGTVTWFTVDPAGDPSRCTVTISTRLPGGAGLLGRIGKAMLVRFLRPIYREELERLEAVVRQG